MTLTYGEYNSSANRMAVYISGSHYGDIRATSWGWNYVPKGCNAGGVTFSTINVLKQSLAKHLDGVNR
jgi:hypothetical protein